MERDLGDGWVLYTWENTREFEIQCTYTFKNHVDFSERMAQLMDKIMEYADKHADPTVAKEPIIGVIHNKTVTLSYGDMYKQVKTDNLSATVKDLTEQMDAAALGS